MAHRKSITVGIDDRFFNIPTVVGGKQVSAKKAVGAAQRKGLGRGFKNIESAVTAAKTRSRKSRSGAPTNPSSPKNRTFRKKI